MKLHELFQEQTGLAESYLDDGAPFSAARVLRELAVDLERGLRHPHTAGGNGMKLWRDHEDHELTLALEVAKQAEQEARDRYGSSTLRSDQAYIMEKMIRVEGITEEINSRNRQRLTNKIEITRDIAGAAVVFAIPAVFMLAGPVARALL